MKILQNELKPTMTWEEAPDIIDQKDLAKILGVCEDTAKDKFDERKFPKIPGLGTKRKADKKAVQLYLQGLYNKDNLNETRQNMIIIELQKILERGKLA